MSNANLASFFHVPPLRRWGYLFDLLVQMVTRDLKVLYKRSVVGVLWSLCTPLMQLVVFVFVFQNVLAVRMPGASSYAAFTFVGILAWSWFSTSISQSANAVTGNRGLIKRPGFPAAILPVATLTMNLMHFIFAMPILLVFLLMDHAPIGLTLLQVPVVMLVQCVVTLSFSYLVAGVNVLFRDAQHIVGVLLPLMFYLTPVFYDPSHIPPQFSSILLFNPMAHVLSAYRAIFIHGLAPDWISLGIVMAVCGTLLFLTHRMFIGISYRFVDEL